MQPVLFVVISEMCVDWLKHAFITKFNHIRASVYSRYTDVLAKDVMQAGNFSHRTSRNVRLSAIRAYAASAPSRPVTARRPPSRIRRHAPRMPRHPHRRPGGRYVDGAGRRVLDVAAGKMGCRAGRVHQRVGMVSLAPSSQLTAVSSP